MGREMRILRRHILVNKENAHGQWYPGPEDDGMFVYPLRFPNAIERAGSSRACGLTGGARQ